MEWARDISEIQHRASKIANAVSMNAKDNKTNNTDFASPHYFKIPNSNPLNHVTNAAPPLLSVHVPPNAG